jgi:hypothetical protein
VLPGLTPTAFVCWRVLLELVARRQGRARHGAGLGGAHVSCSTVPHGSPGWLPRRRRSNARLGWVWVWPGMYPCLPPVPGGLSNPGEDIGQAAVREVFEETGVNTRY